MAEKEKTIVRPVYGAGHTKKYTKSVVADFLIERCADSEAIHINSVMKVFLT